MTCEPTALLHPTYPQPRSSYPGHLRVSDERDKGSLVFMAPESKHPRMVPVKEGMIGMRYCRPIYVGQLSQRRTDSQYNRGFCTAIFLVPDQHDDNQTTKKSKQYHSDGTGAPFFHFSLVTYQEKRNSNPGTTRVLYSLRWHDRGRIAGPHTNP